ncbi:MAG: hypothetical protein VYB92_01590 [Pseudomonadota bacterium]|jgi:hypothetical protein|nr:hypothetical protein [Pseudomonadota bacterium]
MFTGLSAFPLTPMNEQGIHEQEFIQRLFTGGAQHGIRLRHANRHHTSTCPMGTGVPSSANI